MPPSKKSVDRDVLIVAVLAFGIGCLFAGALSSGPLRQASIKSSDLAAWVQAVGSVAAIAVAILVPYSIWKTDDARRVRNERLRARSYAIILLPHADNLFRQLSISLLLAAQLDDLLPRLRKLADVKDWALQIHEIGPTGSLLQTAIAAVSDAARVVEDHVFYKSYGGKGVDKDTGEFVDLPRPDDFVKAVMQAEALARAAADALRRLVYDVAR